MIKKLLASLLLIPSVVFAQPSIVYPPFSGAYLPVSPISNPPHALVYDESTTNLVTDPSDEGAGTIFTASGSNSTVSQDATTAYSGSKSTKTIVTPATTGSGVTLSAISVNASTGYVGSVYCKGNAGGEAITFRLTGDHSSDSTSNRPVTLSTAWERIFINKTTDSSDTTLTFKALTTNNSSAYTWFCDAWQLEQKTSFPTAYVDGSIGPGNIWNGTAHASTSTRAGGLNLLAPITAGSLKPFEIRPDGYLGVSYGGMKVEPINKPIAVAAYNFDFLANQPTTSLISEGPYRFYNAANGNALWVRSGVTTDFGTVFEYPYLTTGAGFAIAAPSDKTNFTGEYFKFLDKGGKDDWKFSKNRMQMGTPAENLDKYLQLLGGGAWAKTDGSSKSGTITSNGTGSGTVSATLGSSTLTGSGTSFGSEIYPGCTVTASGQTKTIVSVSTATSLSISPATWSPAISAGTAYTSNCLVSGASSPAFTTDYAVGDVISASSQNRKILNITSNSLMSIDAAFSPTLSGASHAKATAAYSPAAVFFEGPEGDHREAGAADLIYPVWFSGSDRPKYMVPAQTAGSGTATSLGQSLALSTANTLAVGDIVCASTQCKTIQKVASTTQYVTVTPFSPALSAASFTYQQANSTTYPTADTSGQYFVTRETRATDTVTTTNNQTEQSILSSTITIPAGRMGTDGGLRVIWYGTISAGGTTRALSWLMKLGSTTLTTTPYQTLTVNAVYSFRCEAEIQNTSASAQKSVLKCTALNDTGTTAVVSWVNYGASSVSTTVDNALDLRVDFNTANGQVNKEMVIIEEL